MEIKNQEGNVTVEVQKGSFNVQTKKITKAGKTFELWAVEIKKNGLHVPVAIYSNELSAKNEIRRLFKTLNGDDSSTFAFQKDDTIFSALGLYEELKIAGYFKKKEFFNEEN